MNPYTTTYTTLMGYSVTTNGERCMVAAPNGEQDISPCSTQGYCPAFNTAFPCSTAAYAPYVRDVVPPGGILVPPEGITVPITSPGTFPPADGAGTLPLNSVLRF
ncbi:Hypothetical protein BRZCDTV_33 [Brazilian cedratvirus IHUMI]|uniref:Uncharacterized protein n=1 Tax=Brazilian cedratvirus IHUMI TaxID=2126980 RepID=A0A2R8FCW1_9VIRU|nr:Hypothetical protein BRZCDTV_33 [Brazilian cedratvirus IHUMI]